MKKTSLLIRSALSLILCWLAGLIIIAFFPLCYQRYGVIMCFIFGFCSLGAAMCIYADFCYKAGGQANTRSNRDAVKPNDKHFGAIIGLVPTVINYVYTVPLYLSKFGIMKTDFFPIYKTLTFYFMPFTYIFAPNTLQYNEELERSVSVNVPAPELSAGAMILVTILPLFFLFICWISYYVGHEHIDLKEKVLYGNRNKNID